MDMKQLFEKGVSFIEFVNQDKDTHKEKTLEIYNNAEIQDTIKDMIKSIDEKVNILVFAEIWCPDCMINVPALQKISDENSNFNLSIIPREGNESYLEEYKVGGKAKIPTFVFMDKDFNKMGAFVEKPLVVKNIEENGTQPEIIVTKRKYRKGEYVEETIKEIINIIKK
ncbi:thioredoxin family protein [Anaeromicrobium sediminis]|uniref:Thioredoxin family protein n=1 Tax=Anaeromicrobium sediminis TaxID=1478221 RepID=A0A267MD54_9FIRM|nr:thioredoxin family protein [Anaeromicrobium sediminis]PAB57511.1 thioredoxin family protein [Anaeromicrobium sediminis]